MRDWRTQLIVLAFCGYLLYVGIAGLATGHFEMQRRRRVLVAPEGQATLYSLCSIGLAGGLLALLWRAKFRD